MFNEDDAKAVVLELFKGVAMTRTMNTLQTLFPDLDVATARFDELSCQILVRVDIYFSV